MRIDSWRIESYKLKFQSPFRFADTILRYRDGYYLYLRSGNKVGVGEISPLPEFTLRDPKLIEHSLALLDEELQALKEELTLQKFKQIVYSKRLAPEVESGFEQAYLQLLKKNNSIELTEIFGKPGHVFIKVNAVIPTGTMKIMINSVQTAVRQGFKTIKLKVGQTSLRFELLLLKKIREQFGETLGIRLDANGSWDIKEASSRLSKYAPFNIEYIEQPVAKLVDYLALKESTHIPLAADESLSDTSTWAEVLARNEVDVFIVKPAVMGALLTIVPLIKLTERRKKKVIITTSLDTTLGRRKAVVAAAYCQSYYYHGLSETKLRMQYKAKSTYPVLYGRIVGRKLYL